jgi:signal transduction histidine kinase
VPLLPTIRTVEHLMTPQVDAKEIFLRFAGCDANLAVRADPDPLRQILLNLVGNAVKFTDRGGRIAIVCHASDDTVDVHVEDTGIGIAADQLDYIFEPFVQVDPRLTRSEGGVGLGLAISRDLARGMGGDISVTSRVGEGSVFVLRLRRDVLA